MKRTVLLMAALIVPSLLCWAAVGFVAWNWNPSEWQEGSRVGLLVIAFLATFSACMAVPEE